MCKINKHHEGQNAQSRLTRLQDHACVSLCMHPKRQTSPRQLIIQIVVIESVHNYNQIHDDKTYG